MSKSKAVQVTEEQVLYFRARRGLLAGAGAADPQEAARTILGAQSQQLGPSLLALSQRTRGRPTAARLQEELLEAPRRLVRTWGQRDTIHVYDAAAHWAGIVAARPHWSPPGRRGAMPSAKLLERARLELRKRGTLGRTGLIPLLPKEYVRRAEERTGLSGEEALRFAAGRVLWKLTHSGDACAADRIGAEQRYASRQSWFPELDWPDPMPEPAQACVELARRYLSVNGPASASDLAHHFGARISRAEAWLRQLAKETGLIDVRCGQRKGLKALETDLDELTEAAPRGNGAWPLRMLPLWDTLLMGHADKSWTVPEESERKRVWRPSAVVAASVLARGRIVATWSHKKKARHLEIVIQPLSLWKIAHAKGVRREAEAIARHLELGDVRVEVEGG